MPNFTDPFPGIVPGRLMTPEEAVGALRLDLAAEEDAIHLYTTHAYAMANKDIRDALLDIADEERVHAGEFLRMIEGIAVDEAELMQRGANEIERKFPRLVGVGL